MTNTNRTHKTRTDEFQLDSVNTLSIRFDRHSHAKPFYQHISIAIGNARFNFAGGTSLINTIAQVSTTGNVVWGESLEHHTLHLIPNIFSDDKDLSELPMVIAGNQIYLLTPEGNIYCITSNVGRSGEARCRLSYSDVTHSLAHINKAEDILLSYYRAEYPIGEPQEHDNEHYDRVVAQSIAKHETLVDEALKDDEGYIAQITTRDGERLRY